MLLICLSIRLFSAIFSGKVNSQDNGIEIHFLSADESCLFFGRFWLIWRGLPFLSINVPSVAKPSNTAQNDPFLMRSLLPFLFPGQNGFFQIVFLSLPTTPFFTLRN